MRNLSSILITLIISTSLYGQTTFMRNYGHEFVDYASSVRQTNDQGFIMLGSSIIDWGNTRHTYLVKTDKYGDIIWTKTYVDSTNSSTGQDVLQTVDGGYVFTSSKTGPLGISLTKTDAQGEVMWEKRFQNNFFETHGAIARAPDGGFVILGHKSYQGDWNPYVLRVSATGDSLWGKMFGSNDTVAYSICATNSGYIICGGAGINMANNQVLIKFDDSGNRIWTKLFGSWGGYNQAKSLAATSDGGFVVTGYTTGSSYAASGVMTIRKFNDTGAQTWERTYPGGGSACSIVQTADGGYAVLGSKNHPNTSNPDFYLMKTNSQGIKQWEKQYGDNPSESGRQLITTVDGGFALFGDQSPNAISYNITDFWLIRTDANGDVHPEDPLFLIYPVPTGGILHFRHNKQHPIIRITIYDMLGQLVRIETEPAGDVQLTMFDTSLLAHGAYFIQLETEGEVSDMLRFVAF